MRRALRPARLAAALDGYGGALDNARRGQPQGLLPCPLRRWTMDTQTLITELQSFGSRLAEAPRGAPPRRAPRRSPPPARATRRRAAWTSRRGGAGPTQHVAATLRGATVMIPIHTDQAAASPFVARLGRDGAGTVERDGQELAPIALVKTPRLCPLDEGRHPLPQDRAAARGGRPRLDGAPDVHPVHGGARRPARSARSGSPRGGAHHREEDAGAARRGRRGGGAARRGAARDADDGHAAVGGSGRGAPRRLRAAASGRASICRCRRSASRPDDFAWFERMRAAGVDSLGMHLEAVEDEVRAAAMPGKAEVSVAATSRRSGGRARASGAARCRRTSSRGSATRWPRCSTRASGSSPMGVYPFLVPLVAILGRPGPIGAALGDFSERSTSTSARCSRGRGCCSTDVKAGCARSAPARGSKLEAEGRPRRAGTRRGMDTNLGELR